MKQRAFIPPGETLELAAILEEADDRKTLLRLSARMGGKTIAGARVTFDRGAAA